MLRGGSDTIRSKDVYKQKSEKVGVNIKNSGVDNGVYKSTVSKDEIATRRQSFSFSGVGTHGQNKIAERGIQTAVNSTRTMMLHQALLSPEYSDIRLWPFALTHATYIWNRFPNEQHGLASLEICTVAKLDGYVLRNKKMRGWPVYVLDQNSRWK